MLIDILKAIINKKIAITRKTPANLVAIIPNNASLSNALDIGESSMQTIHMPTDWDAAVITFASSDELNGLYQGVYDVNGTEVTMTTAADRDVPFPVEVAGCRFIKLRSGTVGTPVAQTPARTIPIILKG